MMVGMTLHSSSSGRLPSMRAPISPSCVGDSGCRSRSPTTATASAKNALTREDEEIQRVDVLGERRRLLGKDGNAEYCHELVSGRAVIAPDRHEHESDQRHERHRAAQPHGAHRHEPVIARRRIVVIAVEQQPDRPACRSSRPTIRSARTSRRAASSRCRRSSATALPAGVATTMPLACANCCVCLVPGVVEARRLGQRVDRRLSPVRKCQPCSALGRL